jgi:hypothetical protein
MIRAGTTPDPSPSAILHVSFIAADVMNTIVDVCPLSQIRHESLRIGG